MVSLVRETQIHCFWNNYSKWAPKSYTKDLQTGFPHSVRTLCPNFKKLWRLWIAFSEHLLTYLVKAPCQDKFKKTVTDVCFHVFYMPYFKLNVPRARKITCILLFVYVLCMQKLFDIHEKMCMQIISQLKLLLFPS